MFDQYHVDFISDKMEAIACKPKTLSRTLNTALISWEDVFSDEPENASCILQMENPFHEWKNVYWFETGRKKQFLVQDLSPCSYYHFRLKRADAVDDSGWVYFKSGTDAIPYFVMHFTRAVKFGKTPVIRKIINKRPILLETENKEGKTPLIQAIESGNMQMVLFLINLGANVNTATLITKRTPLMVSLFRDNLQISSLLVDRGAHIVAKDCNSLTGLHHAVDSGCLHNVAFCLNHGFNINALDNKGWTPLLRAVVLHCCDEIISLLLEKGADFTIKDRSGFDFSHHIKLTARTRFEEYYVANVPNRTKDFDDRDSEKEQLE